MKVAIIYHSGFGHTKIVAERIVKGAKRYLSDVTLLTCKEAMTRLNLLCEADTLVFGSPTYFGSISAEFKEFMESTTFIWSKQLWKNKLAAGFTNSASTNGDKLNTLTSLCLFASQHSMLWVPLGFLPKYDSQKKQLPEHNGMASYIGLMTLSDNSRSQLNEPADLMTAELFGERIGEITLNMRPMTAA